MSHLIFADRPTADARNHAAAVAKGAGAPADTTQYWWATVDHPTDGRRALIVPDSDQAMLTANEVSALVASLTSDWTPQALVR